MTADYRFNVRGVRKIDVRITYSRSIRVANEEPFVLMFMSTVTEEVLRVSLDTKEALRLRDALTGLIGREGQDAG